MDTEVWLMSDETKQLESIQLDIVCCDDIQVRMITSIRTPLSGHLYQDTSIRTPISGHLYQDTSLRTPLN